MLSSVACIVDKWGGRRVVVTELWRMKFHINHERAERLYVVPGLLIQEPFDAIAEAPRLISAAEGYALIANRETPLEDCEMAVHL